MEFLPTKPVFDEELYSEQMDVVLSEIAKQCNTMARVPRKKFERDKFLSAVGEAFDLIGGVPRFALWADKNLGEFYKICSKTMPQSNLLDIVGKVQHTILPALPPSALDEDHSVVATQERRV